MSRALLGCVAEWNGYLWQSFGCGLIIDGCFGLPACLTTRRLFGGAFSLRSPRAKRIAFPFLRPYGGLLPFRAHPS